MKINSAATAVITLVLCASAASALDAIINNDDNHTPTIAQVPPPGAAFCAGPRFIPPMGMPIAPPFLGITFPARLLHSAGIELSGAQIDRLAELKDQFITSSSVVFNRLQSLNHDLIMQFKKTEINKAEIRSISGQIAEERTHLDALATDNMILSLQVFTAEQRHKLQLEIEQREVGLKDAPGLDR